MKRTYGWGIVDKDGDVVGEFARHADMINKELALRNDNGFFGPYRVVRLTYEWPVKKKVRK